MRTEQELKELLGQNIKKRRVQRKWSQEKLAENTNLTRNTISDIEAGQDFAGAKTLISLAIALETEVYELFKPEGVLPDKPSDILSKFSEEIRQKVDEIGNLYIAKTK